MIISLLLLLTSASCQVLQELNTNPKASDAVLAMESMNLETSLDESLLVPEPIQSIPDYAQLFTEEEIASLDEKGQRLLTVEELKILLNNKEIEGGFNKEDFDASVKSYLITDRK